MTSIHDRYAAQPNELENLCLAKFAVSYDVQYSSGCHVRSENSDLFNDDSSDHSGEDVSNVNYHSHKGHKQ